MAKQDLRDGLHLGTHWLEAPYLTVSANSDADFPYLCCRTERSTVTGLGRGTGAYKTVKSGVKMETARSTYHLPD
jgi:hypothetical protein